MINKTALVIYLPLLALTACGEMKTISKNNRVYEYEDNSSNGVNDSIIEYTVTKSFKSKIKDKTDYYQFTTIDPNNLQRSDGVAIDPNKVINYQGLAGFYTSESGSFLGNKKFENTDFKYFYGKFVLSSMTVPLKYRFSVGNDSLNPPTWETGFNVNFAPSYRLNWSKFNPTKKFLGNSLINGSLTFSGLFGVSGVSLKKASNAPGLVSDRTASAVSFGFMLSGGVNTIGFGLALGWDKVLGSGGKYWVYQKTPRPWIGFNISVDLIK